MQRFLFVYRRANEAWSRLTPEDMRVRLQKWTEWIGAGKRQGWLLDPGDALQQEGRVVRPPNLVVDGPFTEAKEVVGGYSVVQAESLDAAVDLAKSCPVLLFGASVEVRCLAEFTPKT